VQKDRCNPKQEKAITSQGSVGDPHNLMLNNGEKQHVIGTKCGAHKPISELDTNTRALIGSLRLCSGKWSKGNPRHWMCKAGLRNALRKCFRPSILDY